LAARFAIVREAAVSSTYHPPAPVARLGGQSELGAAALLKAVSWGMRLASLLTHLLPPPYGSMDGYLVMAALCNRADHYIFAL